MNQAFDELVTRLAKPGKVFLIGVSMGASLCCLLAKDKEKEASVAGLILLAPAFAIAPWKRTVARYLARLFPHFSLYKGKAAERYFHGKQLSSYARIPVAKIQEMTDLGGEAFKQLERIDVPIYMFAGLRDHTVSFKKIRQAAALLKNLQKGHCVRFLKYSQHILTVEPDRREVFQECVRFMRERLES